MPKRIEVDRQDGSTTTSKRRFDERDFKYLAEFVIQEYERRKARDERKDKEKFWKEIDRQVNMKPEVEYKKVNGVVDANKKWMAEMELPLQAQALEVLTADCRRMQFPDNGPWFRAHAEMTDDYLDKVNFKDIIHGDKMQVPSELNQDNTDKLVEGFLAHCFRQYDHVGRFDQINAEAIKYGMGVGRARLETKKVFIHESMGTRSENQNIPVIVPVSIKNTYLDDTKPSMHSSHVFGPAHIAYEYMRYENLAVAVNKGSNNPDDPDGGWMPKQMGKVHPDKNGYLQIMEIEGDIIVPRKTVRSVVIPGCIITVALGGGEKPNQSSKAVVRLRFRKYPWSSYLLFPYHFEGSDQIYPTSPLMKGYPVQMMATDALNRSLDSAMLKNAPPISYDPNDPYFAQNGGPDIYPYAKWQSADAGSIKAHVEIGGDPSQLFSIMMQGIGLYAQLTGVLPARLGAQTISHTTAYAKTAELQQGAVRTVDFVNQSGHGPIRRWLEMAYQLGRDALDSRSDTVMYIDAYGGYVSIGKEMLPEKTMFEWFGSGGPAEENQRKAQMIQALEIALKMDALNMQTGKPPMINISEAIKEVLRKGGWNDLESIVAAEQPAQQSQQMMPQQQQNPGAAVAALQNLSGAGG